MFFSKFVGGASIGAISILSVVAGSPAQATVLVDFPLEGTEGITEVSKTYVKSGLSLQVFNPAGTDIPSTGGINATNKGLCIWAKTDANGRCAYVPGVNGATFNSSLNSLQFSFNQPVTLKSFKISQLANVFAAQTQFATSSGILETFNFNSLGSYSFSNPPFIAANTPITISSSAFLANNNIGGLLRIDDFQVEAVPSPLPLLGFSAVIAYSRKLKDKLKPLA